MIDRETQYSSRGPLLLTSFRTWRSHQGSNSSHDLIAAMQSAGQLPSRTIWLPNLPVNFELAPIRVISAIYRFCPQAIVCCGMAEGRTCLSLEQQAIGPLKTLQTGFDLPDLLADTKLSEISADAGRYVCNALYYRVLEALQNNALPRRSGCASAASCLFVHVPVLNASEQFFSGETLSTLIAADMVSVLNKICQ